MSSLTVNFRLATIAGFALVALTSAAHATPIAVSAPNLVTNGSFEQTTVNASSEFGGRYSSQQVTGWTTGGYNFVYLPGTADTTGAASEYGTIKLWGANNGGTATSPLTSPAGGNFLALDGAYAQGPVSQTINGLTVGGTTTVSFFFAGAQQYGYTGATTEQLEVSLGGQNQYTQVLNDTSHGFTGWQSESFTFTPTSTSEVLSFLAYGTPGGEPPMSLLDGVSVTSPVPEPSSFLLLGSGLIGAAGALRRRFKK